MKERMEERESNEIRSRGATEWVDYCKSPPQRTNRPTDKQAMTVAVTGGWVVVVHGQLSNPSITKPSTSK